MPNILLTRQLLQDVEVDALGYGAKDTGQMGAGAAMGILAAAGRPVQARAREKLAFTPKCVGTVVVTEAFGLRARGVKWVCHIISIIKNTAEGAWCPHPELLRGGVRTAIQRIDRLGGASVAFSALGTGEGRVRPERCAQLMIGGAADYFKEETESSIKVYFSLPTSRDFEAFRRVLRQQSAERRSAVFCLE